MTTHDDRAREERAEARDQMLAMNLTEWARLFVDYDRIDADVFEVVWRPILDAMREDVCDGDPSWSTNDLIREGMARALEAQEEGR